MNAERTAMNALAKQARNQTTARRAKPLTVCSVVLATAAWSASATAQSLVYNVWETWEGATDPVYGGVSGGDSDINGAGGFSPTHYSLIGTLGSPGGWWSVGRYFTPPNGRSCTAFAVYRGAGTFTTVQVSLDVIDAPSWTYLHQGSLVNVSRDQGWTWRSGTFTSNGNQIFVRLVLVASSGGSNVNVDDIVVQCT